jgi:hypothetical protein
MPPVTRLVQQRIAAVNAASRLMGNKMVIFNETVEYSRKILAAVLDCIVSKQMGV